MALLLSAPLFMSNLYFITTSRTGLVVIPALLLLFIVRYDALPGPRRRSRAVAGESTPAPDGAIELADYFLGGERRCPPHYRQRQRH